MFHFLGSRRKPDAAMRAEIGARWQARLAADTPSDRPLVVFAIPLIAKARAQDWGQVCRNLALTIGSIRNQRAPDWRVYICAQTPPDGITFDDRVRFVPFRGIVFRPNEKGVRGWDKGDKRRTLIDHIMRSCAGRDGYYAQWDADDLVHPDAVGHVIADNNGRGYVMEQGVMADVATGEMAWFGDGTAHAARKPLWRMCGSSSFVRFDFRTQPRHWRALLLRHSSHKKLLDWQAAHGLPLDPIPFPAGLYSYNNGENLSALKGDAARRNDYLRRNALSAAERADVRAAFGLDALLADAARAAPAPRAQKCPTAPSGAAAVLSNPKT